MCARTDLLSVVVFFWSPIGLTNIDSANDHNPVSCLQIQSVPECNLSIEKNCRFLTSSYQLIKIRMLLHHHQDGLVRINYEWQEVLQRWGNLLGKSWSQEYQDGISCKYYRMQGALHDQDHPSRDSRSCGWGQQLHLDQHGAASDWLSTLVVSCKMTKWQTKWGSAVPSSWKAKTKSCLFLSEI